MGFFKLDTKASRSTSAVGLSAETIAKHQCKVCTLRFEEPKLQPAGSDAPLIYILGEAPGANEVRKREPFVGVSGHLLRRQIPPHLERHIRWNNCVRSRPPENRTPTAFELACCRPSLDLDIQFTQPKAIFGFGNIPLQWAIGEKGINIWRGRRIPIRVGTYACWYYPMFHPSFVLRSQNDDTKKQLAKEYEFVFERDIKNALDEIDGLPDADPHTADDALADITIITGQYGDRDLDRAINFIYGLYNVANVGWDYETKGKRPYGADAKILSVALSGPHGTAAIAFDHREALWTPDQRKRLDDAYYDFLVNAPCRKISHNLQFELEWTGYFYGNEAVTSGIYGCSMSQAHVLDQRKGGKSLQFITLNNYGIDIKKLSGVNVANLDDEPIEDVLRYNAVDAKYHRNNHARQYQELMKQGLYEVYREQVRRVAPIVLTQLRGLPINMDTVQGFHDYWDGEVKKAEENIYKLPIARQFYEIKNRDFRPSAPADMAFVLRDMLGMDDIKSVKESAIIGIRHPIVKATLAYRDAAKAKSTYVDPFMPGPQSVVWPDGLLHPVYNSNFVETDRLSSADPNVQNIPKHEKVELRSQIDPSCLPSAYGVDLRIVTFDFGGIQARNIAMESRDKLLVDSFWTGYDVHSDWRGRIERHAPGWIPKGADQKILKQYRQKAKNGFVFAAFFGAGVPTLSSHLGIPENRVHGIYEEFWECFPEVRAWQQRKHRQYRQLGYVDGLSGFRRRAPVTPTVIINTPIQGDEVAIVCDAWAKLTEMEDERFIAALMVHDDLSFIWPKREIERNAEVVISTMLDTSYDWAKVVPLEIEMSIGLDWASMKEVATYSTNKWNGIVERIPADL